MRSTRVFARLVTQSHDDQPCPFREGTARDLLGDVAMTHDRRARHDCGAVGSVAQHPATEVVCDAPPRNGHEQQRLTGELCQLSGESELFVVGVRQIDGREHRTAR